MKKWISLIRPFSSRSHKVCCYSTATLTKPNVWVVTDGGIESTLQAVSLGRRLGKLHVKTIVANQFLRLFPMVLQKYVVDWSVKRKQARNSNSPGNHKLPWYLCGDNLSGPTPDYVICSSNSAIAGCLQLAQSSSLHQPFSVFLGFTNLPFIHFDQVVIPKYEANVKMAKLGPLAKQRNCIVTEVPLMDSAPLPLSSKSEHICDGLLRRTEHGRDTTIIVIGGHTPQCRWYTENAVTLVDNMKKIVTQVNTNLLVIFTERTTPLIKETVQKNIINLIPNHATRVVTWDPMHDGLTGLERIEAYDNLIHQASRVILTADLDYATAHATMKRKPVYVTFGDLCSGHLLQFHRWLREQRLTRKLRLDRKRKKSSLPSHNDILVDAFSYLGHHPPFGIASKVFPASIMDHVTHEIEAIRQEKLTGKRRQE